MALDVCILNSCNRNNELERGGRRYLILIKATLWLRLLKAFEASTSIIPSVSESSYVFFMACIAASQPLCCPAHYCNDPPDSILITDKMALPIICLHIYFPHTNWSDTRMYLKLLTNKPERLKDPPDQYM